MTAAERLRRTQAADEVCRAALDAALAGRPVTGLALVAVGGYGRSELAPHSDLDVVLVHDSGVDPDLVREVGAEVWYPLWDTGVPLDHSVRDLADVTVAAAADVRVVLGLLDARHLAGDTAVTLRLRADVLSHWRRNARHNLAELGQQARERAVRSGELAHASIPDLKEASGGLRDATVLKALAATWLVDVPHVDLERSRQQILDVRDVLHDVAGRGGDRVHPELWGPLAEGLGLSDPEAAQRHLRQVGRRTAHLARLTWHRVEHLTAPAASPARPRRPHLDRVARGVAVSAGEVVLDRGADPATDPVLLLRAAAEAAERGLELAPASAARLAAESSPLPAPWPDDARDLMVRLLAAGPGLLAVWETLDETGALEVVLPEWSRIRLLPHASAVHRFTVDRHVVETCVEAGRLIRRVARPDLLLVAALLHDIGKGGRTDHSVAGAPVALEVARRMGFGAEDASVVSDLVRWHLLLAETATTRDPEDPATIDHVATRIARPEVLDLLEVLTEADARATGAKAWTSWRAGLIVDLADRVRARLEGGAPHPAPEEPDLVLPASVVADPSYVEVEVGRGERGTTVTVTARDRVGLLADIAGTLSLMRRPVHAARAWTSDGVASSTWQLDDEGVDERLFRQRLEAVVSGSLDPAGRLTPKAGSLPPVVSVSHDASRRSTVLEVRSADRPGVVFLVCRTLAELDLSVRSAHVATWGPQVLDVFYVQEPGAGALSDERAAVAAHAVREALEGAATLDA